MDLFDEPARDIALGEGADLREDRSPAMLQQQWKKLGSLPANADSAEVIKVLGKPDEVRRIPDGHLLDGTALGAGHPRFPGLGPETERWAYGSLGPGMFASGGYVSIDRNGRVVAAIPPDVFSCESWGPLPKLIAATSDRATETPAKMSCRLGPAEYFVGEGEHADRLKTTVTLENRGPEEFRLRSNFASIQMLPIVELYDSKMTLLWRSYRLYMYSPSRYDPSQQPVLSVPAGKRESDDIYSQPGSGFGQLPAGAYSVRVYFPFVEGNFYPSNLVRFDVPARLEQGRLR